MARNPAAARVAWWPVALALALAGCTSTGGGSPASRSHLDAVATLDGHLLSPQDGVLLIEGNHYALTLKVRSEKDVDRLTVTLMPPGGGSGEVTACPTAKCVEVLSDRRVSSGHDLATRWLVPGGLSTGSPYTLAIIGTGNGGARTRLAGLGTVVVEQPSLSRAPDHLLPLVPECEEAPLSYRPRFLALSCLHDAVLVDDLTWTAWTGDNANCVGKVRFLGGHGGRTTPTLYAEVTLSRPEMTSAGLQFSKLALFWSDAKGPNEKLRVFSLTG
jgi:hypothetical protein